jgi:hypothetical protein
VATVGISLVIVLAIFLSTGGREEVGARFQMGKDVLAVLIGVLGTIIGFYFGSEKATPSAGTTGIVAAAVPAQSGQITGTRNTATTPNQTMSGRPSFQ